MSEGLPLPFPFRGKLGFLPRPACVKESSGRVGMSLYLRWKHIVEDEEGGVVLKGGEESREVGVKEEGGRERRDGKK